MYNAVHNGCYVSLALLLLLIAVLSLAVILLAVFPLAALLLSVLPLAVLLPSLVSLKQDGTGSSPSFKSGTFNVH